MAREHSGDSSIAEASEIGAVLGVAEEDVLDQIDILESRGTIIANRTFGSAAPMLTGEGKALLEELEEPEAEEGIGESIGEIVSVGAEYGRPVNYHLL